MSQFSSWSERFPPPYCQVRVGGAAYNWARGVPYVYSSSNLILPYQQDYLVSTCYEADVLELASRSILPPPSGDPRGHLYRAYVVKRDILNETELLHPEPSRQCSPCVMI